MPVKSKKAKVKTKVKAKTKFKRKVKPTRVVKKVKVKKLMKPQKKAKPAAVKKPVKPAKKPVKLVKPKKVVKAPMVKPLSKKALASAVALLVGGIVPYKPKKGEEYMGKEMREHFRQVLQGWMHQLMEDVDKTVHHMQDESANFPDPSDRATQEEGFSLELRTRDRERKLVKKIEEALDMIDQSEYGFCELCGEEIGLRRLEARPTATLCIDCKMLDEIREKQQGT